MLMRIYGLYSLKIENNITVYVILAANTFNTPKLIHEKYDVKGSWVKRSVREHALDPSVLGKDLDLKRKLNVTRKQKQELVEQISSDALFLKSLKIMDYSLLIGFHFVNQDSQIDIRGSKKMKRVSWIDKKDSESKEAEEETKEKVPEKKSPFQREGIISSDGKEIYYVGVIDILQKYDLRKKAERCFKIHCLHSDEEGLSVQPDDIYCERFISTANKVIASN